MSTAVGKPLAGELTYSASVPELAAIFDGSESLVHIRSRGARDTLNGC